MLLSARTPRAMHDGGIATCAGRLFSGWSLRSEIRQRGVTVGGDKGGDAGQSEEEGGTRQMVRDAIHKTSDSIRERREHFKGNLEHAKENVEGMQESIEHIQDEARNAIASPVEHIADSLDESADAGSNGHLSSAIKGEFGEYRFHKAQLKVIEKMVSGIRGCAVASGGVAVVEVLTTVGKAIYPGGKPADAVLIVGGVHVNNIAVILDYGLTSVLLFLAAKSFKRVLQGGDEQLKFVMQGLLQLAFVFMQASTVTASMAIIQLLQAARRWPPLVTWITGLTAAAAVVRALALGRILSKYTPGSGRALAVLLAMRGGQAKQLQRRMSMVDRAALVIVGGLVLPLSVAGEQQKFPETEDEEPRGAKRKKARGLTPEVDTEEEAVALPDEYEFQPQEDQLLELVMNSMRVCATALALQAFSTVCLAAATLVQTNGWMETGWDAYNFVMHLTDQSLRASLLFMAAGFFCRAITTRGHDVENLITALGSQGLSKLFGQTKKVTQGVLSGLFIGWVMSGYQVAKSAGYV